MRGSEEGGCKATIEGPLPEATTTRGRMRGSGRGCEERSRGREDGDGRRGKEEGRAKQGEMKDITSCRGICMRV